MKSPKSPVCAICGHEYADSYQVLDENHLWCGTCSDAWFKFDAVLDQEPTSEESMIWAAKRARETFEKWVTINDLAKLGIQVRIVKKPKKKKKRGKRALRILKALQSGDL